MRVEKERETEREIENWLCKCVAVHRSCCMKNCLLMQINFDLCAILYPCIGPPRLCS